MRFEPIAIVGRACVLPGAWTPESFYAHLRRGQDFLQDAPPGRWRVDTPLIVNDGSTDVAFTDRGGYVKGFDDLFDPQNYRTHPDLISVLDPLFLWSLHTCSSAWKDAGFQPDEVSQAGVILGHLSFPSEHMTAWAERKWLKQHDPRAYEALGWSSIHPYNRFMSGYPAHLVADELGLKGESYCLDAACASALYAIKMAANALHSGRADVMLAGAIQRADSLFLHVGFSALQALSKSGQSRPFHHQADGLIPSEGAAALVLMRLEDAIAQGRQIHGVIRGVGLSNDGRSRGFLAPSSAGQQAAMRAAYEQSGLSPSDVQYVECHATGTTLGDRTELESMAEVWGEERVYVGSHKSNMGHAITAAGMVGTLKVLESMKQGMIPKTIHIDGQSISKNLPDTINVLTESMPWYPPHKRRAAISAFGFGGNNAHMIVEQWSAGDDVVLVSPQMADTQTDQQHDALAVIAVEVIAGDCDHVDEFAQVLFEDRVMRPKRQNVQLDLKGIKFPPRDMEQANSQQWLILRAARQVEAQVPELDWSQTAILVGMQCDTMALRYGARWRMAQWAKDLNASEQWVQSNREHLIGPLEAQSVVGTMPNVPANRLNAQFDARGPSFTISSEECSGTQSLGVAWDMLHDGTAEAALVGAVEMGADSLHQDAAEAALYREQPGMDAACVLVVKTLSKALVDGDDILATIKPTTSDNKETTSWRIGPHAEVDLSARLGHAHSAQSMLDVCAGVLSVLYGQRPFSNQPWLSNTRAVDVQSVSFTAQQTAWTVSSYEKKPRTRQNDARNFRIIALSGSSRAEVANKIERGLSVDWQVKDPVRLFCVVTPQMEPTLQKRLKRRLDAPEQGVRARVALFDEPMRGKVAFVYPGSGSSTAQSAIAQIKHALSLYPQLQPDFDEIVGLSAWSKIKDPSQRKRPWSETEEEMLAILCLSILHTLWTRLELGISPDMASGVSLGESSALFSLGVWRGLDEMVDRLVQSEIFLRDVVGSYDALRTTWFWSDQRKKALSVGEVWQSALIFGPADELRPLVEAQDGVYLTMIHTTDEAVVSGYPEDMKRLEDTLGGEFIVRALPPLASVHGTMIEPIENAYKTLHTREVFDAPCPIYSHGPMAPVEITSQAIANSIYQQAHQPVDYPAMIQRLWDDGARIFIEHGPGQSCSQWIDKTLADQPHLCVSFGKPGNTLEVAHLDTIGTLWAAHQHTSLDVPEQRVHRMEPPSIQVPFGREAHRPPVVFRPATDDAVTNDVSQPKMDDVSHETNDQHPIESPTQPVENLKPAAKVQTDAFLAAMKARRKRADDLVQRVIDNREDE